MLSDDFYQEILAHPVPNDLEAVKVLAESPAILDLYMPGLNGFVGEYHAETAKASIVAE